MFDTILGNEPIQAYLAKALRENRLPQTLLFAGPSGIGKSLFAKALATALLGSDRSPDCHILAPEGKSGLYAIDTVREMIEKEHAAPFEAPGKVFILQEAHRMQPASANALLKTLEEPTHDTTILLLSHAPQEILPTILSRCVTLHFQPLVESHIMQLLQAKGHAPHFAKFSHGSIGRALAIAENPDLQEPRALLFQILSQKPSYPELSLQLQKLEALIEKEKEEDPVRTSQNIEHLLASLLMWHRDQHVNPLSRPEFLFFPDEPTLEPAPLPEVEKGIEKIRLALSRNMKLSVCLTQFFLYSSEFKS